MEWHPKWHPRQAGSRDVSRRLCNRRLPQFWRCHPAIRSAWLHLHPSLQRKLVKYLAEKTENQYVDKLKVAHAVSIRPAELDVYDLKEQIGEVVGFIRAANA